MGTNEETCKHPLAGKSIVNYDIDHNLSDVTILPVWMNDKEFPVTNGIYLCLTEKNHYEFLRFEYVYWPDHQSWIPMWSTADGVGPITGHSWTYATDPTYFIKHTFAKREIDTYGEEYKQGI